MLSIPTQEFKDIRGEKITPRISDDDRKSKFQRHWRRKNLSRLVEPANEKSRDSRVGNGYKPKQELFRNLLTEKLKMEKLFQKAKKLYEKPFVRAGIDSALLHYIKVWLKPRGLEITPIKEQNQGAE